MCLDLFPRGGGGVTPIHYLYGYVPPNGVVILKLLILERVIMKKHLFDVQVEQIKKYLFKKKSYFNLQTF